MYRRADSPSNVITATVVPTNDAATVATTLLSPGAAVTLCRQCALDDDVHAAVAHDCAAVCAVTVPSTVRKFSPLTVMLSATECGRLALSAALTTGATEFVTSKNFIIQCAKRKPRFNCNACRQSKVKAGYRVPTTPPTVTSVVTDDGALSSRHRIELSDVHATVPHDTPSMRLLGVASLCPKLSPATEKKNVRVRELLSTPR